MAMPSLVHLKLVFCVTNTANNGAKNYPVLIEALKTADDISFNFFFSFG
jgi:hypothetical protein